MKELGRIDILVNNAGINVRKPVEALDEVGWDLLLVARCSAFVLAAVPTGCVYDFPTSSERKFPDIV